MGFLALLGPKCKSGQQDDSSKGKKKFKGYTLVTVRCKAMKNITGKEAGESGWNAIWERKRQAKEHGRRLKFVRGLVRHRKEGNIRKKSKK